jgi:hypothetical protein
MNTLLKYVLIVLLAGHVSTVYTMKPSMPTIVDADDDFGASTGPVVVVSSGATTANSATAVSSATSTQSGTMVSAAKPASSATVTTGKNNTGNNLTHLGALVDNNGRAIHVGVNAENISSTINAVANATGSTITTLGKETEKALTGFAQAADTTMQVVNAGVDQLGGTGATAMTKVGNAMANATGEILATAIGQVTTHLNGLTDEGRANLTEYHTNFQNTANNLTTNAKTIVETAGQQAARLAVQGRAAAGQLADGMRASAAAHSDGMKAIGVGIATGAHELRQAATPENIKALGDGQAAITFAEKTGDATTKFIDQGTKLLEKSTQAADHMIASAASLKAIAASAEKQAPAIMGGVANLLQAVTNAANAAANAGNAIAGGMSGQTTNLIAMGETYVGPLISEIFEETKLLALPAAQQFAQQTKMLQLAATAFNKDTPMTVTVAQVLKTAWTAQQKKQSVDAATLAQLRKIVIEKAKAPQQLLLTNGDVPAAAGTPTNTAAPAPVPMEPEAAKTALVAQLQTVLPEQVQPPIATDNQQPQAPKHTWSSFMVAPHPAFVFAACVAVAGIVVVSRKMYLKWKKNKERKEKRKAHKASAQKELVEEAHVVL